MSSPPRDTAHCQEAQEQRAETTDASGLASAPQACPKGRQHAPGLTQPLPPSPPAPPWRALSEPCADLPAPALADVQVCPWRQQAQLQQLLRSAAPSSSAAPQQQQAQRAPALNPWPSGRIDETWPQSNRPRPGPGPRALSGRGSGQTLHQSIGTGILPSAAEAAQPVPEPKTTSVVAERLPACTPGMKPLRPQSCEEQSKPPLAPPQTLQPLSEPPPATEAALPNAQAAAPSSQSPSNDVPTSQLHEIAFPVTSAGDRPGRPMGRVCPPGLVPPPGPASAGSSGFAATADVCEAEPTAPLSLLGCFGSMRGRWQLTAQHRERQRGQHAGEAAGHPKRRWSFRLMQRHRLREGGQVDATSLAVMPTGVGRPGGIAMVPPPPTAAVTGTAPAVIAALALDNTGGETVAAATTTATPPARPICAAGGDDSAGMCPRQARGPEANMEALVSSEAAGWKRSSGGGASVGGPHTIPLSLYQSQRHGKALGMKVTELGSRSFPQARQELQAAALRAVQDVLGPLQSGQQTPGATPPALPSTNHEVETGAGGGDGLPSLPYPPYAVAIAALPGCVQLLLHLRLYPAPPAAGGQEPADAGDAAEGQRHEGQEDEPRAEPSGEAGTAPVPTAGGAGGLPATETPREAAERQVPQRPASVEAAGLMQLLMRQLEATVGAVVQGWTREAEATAGRAAPEPPLQPLPPPAPPTSPPPPPPLPPPPPSQPPALGQTQFLDPQESEELSPFVTASEGTAATGLHVAHGADPSGPDPAHSMDMRHWSSWDASAAAGSGGLAAAESSGQPPTQPHDDAAAGTHAAPGAGAFQSTLTRASPRQRPFPRAALGSPNSSGMSGASSCAPPASIFDVRSPPSVSTLAGTSSLGSAYDSAYGSLQGSEYGSAHGRVYETRQGGTHGNGGGSGHTGGTSKAPTFAASSLPPSAPGAQTGPTETTTATRAEAGNSGEGRTAPAAQPAAVAPGGTSPSGAPAAAARHPLAVPSGPRHQARRNGLQQIAEGQELFSVPEEPSRRPSGAQQPGPEQGHGEPHPPPHPPPQEPPRLWAAQQGSALGFASAHVSGGGGSGGGRDGGVAQEGLAEMHLGHNPTGPVAGTEGNPGTGVEREHAAVGADLDPPLLALLEPPVLALPELRRPSPSGAQPPDTDPWVTTVELCLFPDPSQEQRAVAAAVPHGLQPPAQTHGQPDQEQEEEAPQGTQQHQGQAAPALPPGRIRVVVLQGDVLITDTELELTNPEAAPAAGTAAARPEAPGATAQEAAAGAARAGAAGMQAAEMRGRARLELCGLREGSALLTVLQPAAEVPVPPSPPSAAATPSTSAPPIDTVTRGPLRPLPQPSASPTCVCEPPLAALQLLVVPERVASELCGLLETMARALPARGYPSREPNGSTAQLTGGAGPSGSVAAATASSAAGPGTDPRVVRALAVRDHLGPLLADVGDLIGAARGGGGVATAADPGSGRETAAQAAAVGGGGAGVVAELAAAGGPGGGLPYAALQEMRLHMLAFLRSNGLEATARYVASLEPQAALRA